MLFQVFVKKTTLGSEEDLGMGSSESIVGQKA
jgi:hypothetical protein